MRTDGVHCRESAGTVPIILKVVPVTGATFSGITMDYDQLMCASLSPHSDHLLWASDLDLTYFGIWCFSRIVQYRNWLNMEGLQRIGTILNVILIAVGHAAPKGSSTTT